MAKARKLKTETNTPDIEDRVRLAAVAYWAEHDLLEEEVDVFFEHGQWWVRWQDTENERTFSVVDAVGGDAVDGFSFEEIG